MRFDTDKMNKYYVMTIIITLFFVSFMLVSSFALAVNKATVVLFYTNWDAKSREIKPALEQIVATYNNNVSLDELNVDLPATADQARSLGLAIPRTVPEIIILNKNGRPVFDKVYGRVPLKQLKTDIDQVLTKL